MECASSREMRDQGFSFSGKDSKNGEALDRWKSGDSETLVENNAVGDVTHQLQGMARFRTTGMLMQSLWQPCI
jgi:hypothetical protein